MSRLAQAFAELKRQKRAGLVTYVTAGDPSPAISSDVLRAIAAAGADVLEVGVPFSDPIADGPAIQRATERAMAAGGNLSVTLDMIAGVRGDIAQPIVLFTYVNPVFQMGVDAFVERATAAGVDGVLLLDLPIEESADMCARLGARGRRHRPRLSLRDFAPWRHRRADPGGRHGRAARRAHPRGHRSADRRGFRLVAARASG